MSDEILHNSPALHALKRHQLVSLSKRYGLRASGKNVDMIDRLKDFAANLTPTRQFNIPLPAPTPAMILSDLNADIPKSPCDLSQNTPSEVREISPGRRLSRASDRWEVLSASGASLISPAKDGVGMTNSSSCSSWKSAGNGESLSEFGDGVIQPISSRSKSSSIRSLASSLSRRASKHLMSRSSSATSALDKIAYEEPAPHVEAVAQEEDMEELSPSPPSPASTVGVPRRRSTLSLLERPSTIRLCSPPPTDQPIIKQNVDELPFFGRSTVKERRSMAPLRKSAEPFDNNIHSRKSMPAIGAMAEYTASVPTLYPPLPVDVPPVPPIPGAFKKSSASPAKTFGFSISNEQFSSAAQQVIEDMQARMQARGIGVSTFGEELLKGKQAEVSKLVHTTQGLGEGGWGLRNMASSTSIQDRYAAAHQKDFARMQSIGETRKRGNKSAGSTSTATSSSKLPPATPGKRKHSDGHSTPSAPNGLPLIGNDGREAKRKRLSIGPNGFGSLREAGKSLVSILGDGPKATPARRKRRSSLMSGRFGSRFTGMFKSTRQDSLTRPLASKSTISLVASQTMPSLPDATTTSQIRRAHRATRGGSSVLGLAEHVERRQARDRGRSTSAQTVTSSASSRTPIRSRLPDFGAFPDSSVNGSVNNLGLPKSQSSSLSSSLSMKKQSQAEIIRNARAPPAPPSTTTTARIASGSSVISRSSTSTSIANKRSSTLYQPTASSLARMQATVKPPIARTLPTPPVLSPIALEQPFGTASSRGATFGSAFHATSATKIPSLALRPALRQNVPASPMRTPPKKTASTSAARLRNKASGLSAVKSKGSLRTEAEVNARRADVRAKQQRVGEERALRDLLGQDKMDRTSMD